jgi:hypothetical protein
LQLGIGVNTNRIRPNPVGLNHDRIMVTNIGGLRPPFLGAKNADAKHRL